jgi:hypothetical protein
MGHSVCQALTNVETFRDPTCSLASGVKRRCHVRQGLSVGIRPRDEQEFQALPAGVEVAVTRFNALIATAAARSLADGAPAVRVRRVS